MNIYQQISALISQNKEAVVCIITETTGSSPRKAGSKMLVHSDGKTTGTVGGGSIEYQAIADAMEVLKTCIPRKKIYKLEEDLAMHCGGTVEIYFEPIKSSSDLFIFGAGHIGRALSRYAADFGFRITLFDQREEILKEFDSAPYHCVCEDFYTAIEKAKFTEKTFSVIVTPKHEYDENIVMILAKKPFAYLGMIGSKSKVAEAKKKMLEKGFTQKEIDRIDMPIGIKFNAETPEEIAISIIAKLIDVKNSLNK
ncbi:MAG: xanthine dehydrogenase accessory protein XdhC [Bacteroidales bacterium]|jgi:xanthine dehydrogenase accessory factor|nr:xanthine dehydrogenase accessory protein XdhC [Bacteroidales bacterium]MDD4214105.1 xanthine dehydrogenase accessory protein XdhC [Bacteroidales bacterium]